MSDTLEYFQWMGGTRTQKSRYFILIKIIVRIFQRHLQFTLRHNLFYVRHKSCTKLVFYL